MVSTAQQQQASAHSVFAIEHNGSIATIQKGSWRMRTHRKRIDGVGNVLVIGSGREG